MSAEEELLLRIAAAFAGVPRPGAITKSVARALDDEWEITEERQVELLQQDPETDWRELTDEDLQAFDDIFVFLDAEGYRFYAPAFMSYALRGGRAGGWMGIEYLCSACVPTERFALFTPAQVSCLLDFLTLCAAGSDYVAESAAGTVDYLEQNLPRR